MVTYTRSAYCGAGDHAHSCVHVLWSRTCTCTTYFDRIGSGIEHVVNQLLFMRLAGDCIIIIYQGNDMCIGNNMHLYTCMCIQYIYHFLIQRIFHLLVSTVIGLLLNTYWYNPYRSQSRKPDSPHLVV